LTTEDPDGVKAGLLGHAVDGPSYQAGYSGAMPIAVPTSAAVIHKINGEDGSASELRMIKPDAGIHDIDIYAISGASVGVRVIQTCGALVNPVEGPIRRVDLNSGRIDRYVLLDESDSGMPAESQRLLVPQANRKPREDVSVLADELSSELAD